MMKKLISFLLSITLCSSMMTIFPAASWDLNEEQAVEGDISSYVQVEEVTFGEPEPIAEPLNEEELYQLEWVGDLFEAETETDEAQPMAFICCTIRNRGRGTNFTISGRLSNELSFYSWKLWSS